MQKSATPRKSRTAQLEIPLSRALGLYEAALRAGNRSGETIVWYHDRLSRFFAHLQRQLGRDPMLGDLTPQLFRLFILEKQASTKNGEHPRKPSSSAPLSSSYIHGFYRAVRAFSSWLHQEQLLRKNPMASLSLPKLDEPEAQPLTPDEELRLIDAYSDLHPIGCRDKAIVMLMLSTGLRKAEVIGLKEAAVNLQEGFITVWGKGRKQRSIPFGYKTGWVLQRYRTLFRPEPAIPNADTFFLTDEGYSMTKATIQMIFARAQKRTGITRLHAHLLRHTFGTRSAELGIPTLTLQRYMGHSQSTITERYSHIAQNERLKRERGYDHLDQLSVRVRRPTKAVPR